MRREPPWEGATMGGSHRREGSYQSIGDITIRLPFCEARSTVHAHSTKTHVIMYVTLIVLQLVLLTHTVHGVSCSAWTCTCEIGCRPTLGRLTIFVLWNFVLGTDTHFGGSGRCVNRQGGATRPDKGRELPDQMRGRSYWSRLPGMI